MRELLEQLVARIPPPKDDSNGPLRALIIDSWFDAYLGVVSLVRIFAGELTVGEKIKIMSTGKIVEVDQVGIFTPKRRRAIL